MVFDVISPLKIALSPTGSGNHVTFLFIFGVYFEYHRDHFLNFLKHLKLILKKCTYRSPLKYQFQNFLILSHLSESIDVPAW